MGSTDRVPVHLQQFPWQNLKIKRFSSEGTSRLSPVLPPKSIRRLASRCGALLLCRTKATIADGVAHSSEQASTFGKVANQPRMLQRPNIWVCLKCKSQGSAGFSLQSTCSFTRGAILGPYDKSNCFNKRKVHSKACETGMQWHKPGETGPPIPKRRCANPELTGSETTFAWIGKLQNCQLMSADSYRTQGPRFHSKPGLRQFGVSSRASPKSLQSKPDSALVWVPYKSEVKHTSELKSPGVRISPTRSSRPGAQKGRPGRNDILHVVFCFLVCVFALLFVQRITKLYYNPD